MIRETVRFCCPLITAISLAGSLAAEEPKPADAETIRELKDAYAKLKGYLCTYHSEKKSQNATLDITSGLDQDSGVAVLWVNMTRAGQRSEMKAWITAGGVMYSAVGGELYRTDVVALGTRLSDEMKGLVENDHAGSFSDSSVLVSVCLEQDSIGAKLGFGERKTPPWSQWIAGSTIKESTAESVTFATAERGELTISRKTGLLVRQSLPGRNGEERVLELRDPRLNPGQGEVAKIFAGWKTEGAMPMEGGLVVEYRRRFLVSMIEEVEKGRLKLTELQEYLKGRRQALLDFVADGVVETKGSVAAFAGWDTMFEKENLKKEIKPMMEQQGLKDMGNDEDWTTYFSSREQREQTLRAMVKMAMTQEKLQMKVFGEFFGMEEGLELEAETADGKAAAKLIREEVARAYFTTLFERKMLKLWGPPKD